MRAAAAVLSDSDAACGRSTELSRGVAAVTARLAALGFTVVFSAGVEADSDSTPADGESVVMTPETKRSKSIFLTYVPQPSNIRLDVVAGGGPPAGNTVTIRQR